VVAQRFVAHNVAVGRKGNTAIEDEVRARIRTEVARELFAEQYGRPAADERELSGFIARGSRQSTTAVAGYDLTFSPVKSVSTLWAVAPREVSKEIEAAHRAAVADVIGWLQTHAAYTRLGAHGVRQVETHGLIGAAFTHRDSRAGDPDLHTHVAISNKVQTTDTDGTRRWLALDGRTIHKTAVAASERYNTRLEAHLVDRLGMSFAARVGSDSSKRAVREIVGVEEKLSRVWSARRASIEVRRGQLAAIFQAAHGRTPSAVESLALAQQATFETREAKHAPRSHAEQRQQWRHRAVTVLGGDEHLAAMIHAAVPAVKPQPRTTIDEQWISQTAAAVVTTVSQSRATWQPDHIRAEAERAARSAGVGLAELDAGVDAVVAAALGPAVSVRLSAPDLVTELEPSVLRRSDGASVYSVARTQLYTSGAVMDAESRLLAAAHRTDGLRISDNAVDMALLESAANGVELNPRQMAMVRELATSGPACRWRWRQPGPGRPPRCGCWPGAWGEEGGTVVGLAPTAAAAAVLGADLHAPTDTLDKLVHTITELATPAHADHPVRVPHWVAGIGPDTLVIVDEAGMAGTPQLDTAVAHILARGGSVRLVGDDQQLASVSAGGVVRDIADTVGAVTLAEVVRFTDPAEGAASLVIRAGDPAGIGFYIDNNRVHVGDSATVVEQAYSGWATDTAAGVDAVMLAPTREMAAALNTRARADRIAAEQGPLGREVALRNGAAASVGDVITTRRNDRRLVITANDWVRNGNRFTICDVHPDGSLRVRHRGTARVITLPADYVARDVDLGYARTVHAAQGLTAEAAHTVATGAESRQLLYVAMTRGRVSNQLYVQTVGDGDPHTMITPEHLLPPTAVDVLNRMVAYDGTQHSVSTTGRELADPTAQLTHAAGAYTDALGVAAEFLAGPAVLATIDTTAEALQARLTAQPTYPTLRAHLAILSLQGRDPAQALRAAAESRELATADDVAAVLDWRLDTTGRHSSRTAPLPWLPGLPEAMNTHPQWGPYLTARARAVTDTAIAVRSRAQAFTPTSAPLWARSLVGESPELLAELAVWRAAAAVDPADRRPTGPDTLPVVVRRYQRQLDARLVGVLGDPHAALARWQALADSIDARVSADPYWPVLADRFDAANRAGIDIAALAVAATRERPLPDELPAAALWWRLARHLGPSVLDATATGTAHLLRPRWTPALSQVLGDTLAQRVLADPAWPVLVTAVDHAAHAGWEPAQLLGTAHELLVAGHDEDTVPRPADVAGALVFRVQALLEHTNQAAGIELAAAPPWPEMAPTDPDAEEEAAARALSAPAGHDRDSDLPAMVAEQGRDDYLAAVTASEAAEDPDTLSHPAQVGGDWDGALLTELPYTALDPAERVERIAADLDSARARVRRSREQVFDGTSPSLQAAMPTITALRRRAEDLRPAAVTDADTHQLWIDADSRLERAEHTAAQVRHELGAARAAGQAARVSEMAPLSSLALGRVEDAHREAALRRGEYDTAHAALVAQAGPDGVLTAQNVEFARAAATGLDLDALNTAREQVRVLEGALLRAETDVAHQHVLTHSDSGTDQEQRLTARPTAETTTPTTATAAPEASLPGWRTVLWPRPDEPTRQQQWDLTVSMVGAYRSAYHVTTTKLDTPLGAAPPLATEQHHAYQAAKREWRTMTNAHDAPSTGDRDNDLARRAAAARLAELRERHARAKDEQRAQQEGITGERGYGHDPGYSDRYDNGEGHGSQSGY